MSGDWLTRAAVLVGLLLRGWHYAADRTVWYDEAVLLANVLTKDWLALLGPLDHAVAAPPLYLFLLKLVAVTCGDVQLCWRLPSLVAGCATLLATVPLCRRVLPAACVAPCVWLVALSDNHIWHTVTVKPYAGDALLTTLLLLGLVSTDRRPAGRRLWWLVVVAPVVLCLSYPMAFVLGGILLALLPTAWRARRTVRGGEQGSEEKEVAPAAVAFSPHSPAPRPSLFPWAVAAAVAAGTFAALYFGPIRVQKVPGLLTEHADYFPSAGHPLGLPGWVVQHTAEVFQYCTQLGGVGLFLLAPLGLWAAWRAGRRELVIALAVPFPLTVAAAALKAYPYGLIRLMLFIAPCCLLLGGLGLAEVWRRSARRGRAVAVVVVLATVVPPFWHVYYPYPRPDSSAVARHIRAYRQPGDLVASDEQCYAYFFRGELLSLNQAAATPDGGRVWVPMDHYTPAERRAYCAAYLAPGGWTLAGEWEFRKAGALLFVRPGGLR